MASKKERKRRYLLRVPADVIVSIEASDKEAAIQSIVDTIMEAPNGYDLTIIGIAKPERIYFPQEYHDEIRVIEDND